MLGCEVMCQILKAHILIQVLLFLKGVYCSLLYHYGKK